MYSFLLPGNFSKMKAKELLCPLAKYQILQRPIWTKSRRGVLDCAKSLPIGTQVSLIVWLFETHVIVWMEWTHQPGRSSSTCFAFLCLALRCLEHATPLLTLHSRRMTSTGKEAEPHNGTSIFFWPFSMNPKIQKHGHVFKYFLLPRIAPTCGRRSTRSSKCDQQKVGLKF